PVRHSLKTEAPRAFDLHVLGMPPAFVLSQDQTLKIIPGQTRLAPRARPKQGLQNARTHARTVSDPRRRPRIPSLSPPSQSTTPRRSRLKGAALIGSPPPPVNTFSGLIF